MTVDNLFQWLVSTDRQTAAPHLITFLQELEVTTHLASLPRILQLHQLLVDRFHRRVALSDMESITVAEFLATRLDGEDETAIVAALMETFLATWNSLRGRMQQWLGGTLGQQLRNLKDHVLDTDLTVNSPAAVLFPSSHGTGLCSFALVRCLLETHNQLVRSDLPPISPVTASTVHLAALTRSQVQLLLLSHTSYSLQLSVVTREEYDVTGIERHILDR